VKIFSFQCDTPGFPLTPGGSLAAALLRTGNESVLGHARGGAIAALKQMPLQGTSVPTRRPETVDFPYDPVRARAQGLT